MTNRTPSSRRTILKAAAATAAGTALGLPSTHAQNKSAGKSLRMAFVYTPNGAIMPSWNPKGEGAKPMETAKALREAQAYVQKQPQWSHPENWAAWVLWGLPD